jgi:hypothetical protein
MSKFKLRKKKLKTHINCINFCGTEQPKFYVNFTIGYDNSFCHPTHFLAYPTILQIYPYPLLKQRKGKMENA